MTPDLLHQLIEAHDPAALAALDAPGALDLDAHNRTAFDVALAAGNQALVGILAARTELHGRCATVDPDLRRPIQRSLADWGPDLPVATRERRLRAGFGAALGLERTPLLQACRHGDMEAVAALLAAGAKPGGKDLLGLSEPELCLASGGPPLLERFVDLCRRHRRKVGLSDEALGQLLAAPETLAAILTGTSLNAAARRLLLCYHCARLDETAVDHLLASGLDLNKTLHRSGHALFEVCTSHLLWERELPGWLPLAWRFTVLHGPPGCQSISTAEDSPLSPAAQVRQARADQARKRAELDAFTLTADALKAQTAGRIRLIERLLAAGLDLDLARRKAPDFFVRDLLGLDLPEILEVLIERGLDLRLDDAELEWLSVAQRSTIERLLAGRGMASIRVETPFLALRQADATWELPVETSVLAATEPASPRAGERFLARVTLHNLYGPLPGCRLFLKQADAPEAAWQEMDLREELIESDGETRPRRPGEPAPAQEAPWFATYELRCRLAPGPRRLALKIQSEDQDLNGVLNDWTLADATP